MTKLKAFADDKLNIAKTTISLYDGLENTVGKGENAGYQHYLLFPQCFPKPTSLESLKIRIVLKRVNFFVLERCTKPQPFCGQHRLRSDGTFFAIWSWIYAVRLVYQTYVIKFVVGLDRSYKQEVKFTYLALKKLELRMNPTDIFGPGTELN